MLPDNASHASQSRAARFATTHWSVVVAAARKDSPEGDEALAALCEAYWYPLYAFARRRGHTPEDAQDLTQEFFARLLERQYLKSADADRGRFRSFLLTVFKRFLSNERERRGARKRGGGWKRLSIDFASGEARYRFEPADDWTPQRVFERRWALTLLEHVMARLGQEFADKGKAELFAACKRHLTGADEGYAATAEALQMSPGAVRVAVHRMRQRYLELLRSEVARTLEDPQAVEQELAELRAALRPEKP